MSRHHKAHGWASISKKLRPRYAAQLPLPCYHCGKPVLATQRWDIAHRRDLALTGDVHDVAGVAHRNCNQRAGGKLGAAMGRAPRTIKARPTREVHW